MGKIRSDACLWAWGWSLWDPSPSCRGQARPGVPSGLAGCPLPGWGQRLGGGPRRSQPLVGQGGGGLPWGPGWLSLSVPFRLVGSCEWRVPVPKNRGHGGEGQKPRAGSWGVGGVCRGDPQQVSVRGAKLGARHLSSACCQAGCSDGGSGGSRGSWWAFPSLGRSLGAQGMADAR